MRNLINDLEKETSGYFEKGLVQIARGPLTSDCYNLFEAMKGMGTKEVVLDDVLVGRSNADINAIKQEYQRLFKKSLESDPRGDLSAGTEQMYMMIIAGRRNEDSHPVIQAETDQAVTDLQGDLIKMRQASAQVGQLACFSIFAVQHASSLIRNRKLIFRPLGGTYGFLCMSCMLVILCPAQYAS